MAANEKHPAISTGFEGKAVPGGPSMTGDNYGKTPGAAVQTPSAEKR